MKPQTHTKRSTVYCRFKTSLLWMGSLLAFAGAALPETASAAVPKPTNDLWVAAMPSSARSQTYANAALNEPITVWGRAWNGTAPYSYVLSFGDGSTSLTGSNITAASATFIGASHTYSSSGTKTASLTVSDSAGHTYTRETVVRVLASPTHDDRVNMAIEKGLLYLYRNQLTRDANRIYWANPFGFNNSDFVATLGAPTLAFEENGHLAKYDYEEEIYAETVQKALNHIVDYGLGAYFNISPHSDGLFVRNSDSNGDGKGAYLSSIGYANAIGAVALISAAGNATEAKALKVKSGPFVGVSYFDLITDIIDQLCYSQGDGGNRGGWVYNINTTDNGRYDGSAQQWPSLVFKNAKDRWGISPPQWVIDNSVFGFQILQDPVGGGAGYSNRSWLNHAKTGGMLVSYDFAGKSIGDVDVNKGIKFIGDNWYSTIVTGSGGNNGGWVGGELYAMYGVKKGLQLQDVSTVTTTAGQRDWYKDLSAWLLGNASLLDNNLGSSVRSQSANAFGQFADGHWETTMWPVGALGSPNQPLQTAFSILILTKSVTVALPVAVIAPVPDQSSKNPGVTMDGSGSYHTDSSLSIVEYLWDFNAANGVDWSHPDATGINPRNPGYTTPGTYTVTLRVKDNSNPAETATTTIQIKVIDTDVPPVAIAIPPGSPGYAGKVGDVITLDGSASYDPDGDVITDYSWDLNGDGIFGDAHGVNPTVTFSSEYSGEVRLQVTANGKTAKSTATVSIAGSTSDLYVSSISAANVVLGTNADIHVVLNSDVNSTKSFNNVSVKFYNNNPLTGGIQVGSNYTVNLPAGGSAVIDAHLTGIGNATNIFAYVDATKSIPEWDELNNILGVGILNQRPTISCASDVTAEATSLAGASVDVTVGVNDVDSDPLTVQWFIDNALAESYTLPAGSTSATLSSVYAYGSHSVVIVVTDGKSTPVSCTNSVVITDKTAPTVVCSPDLNVTTDASLCSAVVNYSVSASDVGGTVTMVSTPASGSVFPKGTTTVTVTATDSHNNVATCSFTVTVADKEAPAITAPASVTVNTDASKCEASGVNIGTATATDNCDVPKITSDAPAIFPKGNTTVTWTATDASGNYSKATQVVTVVDKEAPVITAPASVTVNTDAGKCQASGVAIGSATATDNCDVPTITSDAPAIFPKGSTTVTWTATDASGNYSKATQVVTVVDKEAPVITAPASVTVNTDAGKCQASGVAIGTATATDNCDVPTITSDAPAIFPKGSTTVTWTATDASGNYSKATQVVTVVDKEAPVITAPASVTVNTDAGKCQASGVAIGSATATDNCDVPTITSDAPAIFPKGSTTVTWTATDASGNYSKATQVVTVLDKEAPVITAPASVTVNTDAGKCEASGVNISRASAIDNCDIKSISNNAPAIFPKGSTTVTWTAVDTSGNSATATQVVTVVDKEAPTISHTNVVVNTDLGKCSAVVAFTAPVVADNCAVASVVCNPPSGSEFSKGVSTVTCTVVDTAGNSSKTTFTVTVNDSEAPKITCPANITTEFVSTNGVAVTFSVLATDNCPGVQVISTPASGSVFPIGTTTVTSVATDASGNKTTCSFTVTVLGAKGTKLDVLNEMRALRPTVTNKEVGMKLDNAIQDIQDSLAPSLWIDQTHLNIQTGIADFNLERDATTQLKVMQNQLSKHTIPNSTLQSWIDRIVACDRLILTVAINDAVSASATAKCLDSATKFIPLGDSNAAQGDPNAAIVHYRNGWSAITSCK